MTLTKKSTPHRLSFALGIIHVGFSGIFFGPDDLHLSRVETIADTVKVLSRYLDCIVIRTYSYQDVLQLAQHASIPVINGLTDFNHPCQALADMLTLQERFGDLAGRNLADLGDGNNVNHYSFRVGRLGDSNRIAVAVQKSPYGCAVHHVHLFGDFPFSPEPQPC